MSRSFTAKFELTSQSWEQNFTGRSTTSTIATRSELVIGQELVEINGSLDVRGIELKPGQRITAVFTIEGDE